MGNTINQKQMRGIELLSKAMSRKFKFIKEVIPMSNYAKYENLLFVDVIMDYTEFAQMYNYFHKKLIGYRITSSTIAPYVSRDRESWTGPTDDEIYNNVKLIREDIERSLVAFYQSLPKEYQAFWITSWGDEVLREPAVSIYIDTHNSEL